MAKCVKVKVIDESIALTISFERGYSIGDHDGWQLKFGGQDQNLNGNLYM